MTEYYATKLANLDIPYFVDILGRPHRLYLLGLELWCRSVTK